MINSLPFDVSRCESPTCFKRDRCKRFTDSPTGNPMQSYANLTPPPGLGCLHFIPEHS